MSVAFAGLAYASMSTPEQPHKARLEKLAALAVPSPRMRRTKYVSGNTKAAEASTDDSTQQVSAAEGEEAAQPKHAVKWDATGPGPMTPGRGEPVGALIAPKSPRSEVILSARAEMQTHSSATPSALSPYRVHYFSKEHTRPRTMATATQGSLSDRPALPNAAAAPTSAARCARPLPILPSGSARIIYHGSTALDSFELRMSKERDARAIAETKSYYDTVRLSMSPCGARYRNLICCIPQSTLSCYSCTIFLCSHVQFKPNDPLAPLNRMLILNNRKRAMQEDYKRQLIELDNRLLQERVKGTPCSLPPPDLKAREVGDRQLNNAIEARRRRFKAIERENAGMRRRLHLQPPAVDTELKCGFGHDKNLERASMYPVLLDNPDATYEVLDQPPWESYVLHKQGAYIK